MKTKSVVYVAIIAALYAVLTVALAPVSYGPIQFRVSEFLKVFALFNPWTALGLAIGDFFSALGSPFVGPWELIFMPLTDAAGAVIVYFLFRALRRKMWARYFLMLVYAITTGAAVGLMLFMFGVDLFWPLFLSVSASEAIILLVAVPIGKIIMEAPPAQRLIEQ